MLYRSTQPDPRAAGFTLIEALVALAIVAVSLLAIGGLFATTVRAALALDRHLIQLETTRAVIAAIPDRDQLLPGNLSGELAGLRWRVDVSLWVPTTFPKRETRWVPQAVTVTVRSPSGGLLQVDTVRLRPGGGA